MTSRLPTQVFLEITRACNQECPFCSCPWFGDGDDGAASRSELSAAELQEVADELIANGVRHVAVTGGEPTLKDGLTALLRHIAWRLQQCQPEPTTLALYTNGIRVDQALLELLAECGAELYVSLPGLASCALQTGRPGADFREILAVVNAASMRMRVSVGVTVTRAMLPELYKTLSYAVLSGAHAVILNLFKPTGRGRLHPELLLSPSDTLQAAAIAEAVAGQCAGGCVIGGEFPPAVCPADHPHLLLESRCAAARGTFTVAPDGWLHLCEHDPRPVAPWRQWRQALLDPRWRHFATVSQAVCPLTVG